ncbi:polymeric immunoglobulin receptor-like [Girardinichthys multiradiatus]|uniref:polymeric immunoglobulin receptor-like n=1 Tax=Girardinichthys multiradiatus TaxID=208333 RepID=UPI001FAD5B48|nr:polymeric immunoglobulin receptor-like [Girardinichthys multiradiatus]XP_047221522.1 polymeric immunoglobulin receptor-like [Girardinichthys multiradiatus]
MSWSYENLQICLCFALCCVTNAVIHVSGYEGTGVNIVCPYNLNFEHHEKYLCRNDCKQDEDVLVKSTEGTKGRYSTSDNKEKHTFKVTISDLSSKDAGKYWCGVSKFGYDTFPAEVSLKVEKEWCCVKTTRINGIVGSPIMMSCPHPPQHQDKRKFLCKGDHRDNCTDLVTGGSRFTLQDDVSSSSFLVRITKLEEGDAGTYWCGSDSKWSPGNYTKIELTVEWCCAKTNNIQGSVSYPLHFYCPYSPQRRHNRKFLCKGDQRSNCTDVLLSQSRFSLQDYESSSSFSVRITNLEEGDAGTYWCGSDSKWGAGNYTKIELSLEWCCVKTEKMRGIVGHSIALSCPYPPHHWNSKKFLCKGEHNDTCNDVLLNQGRFTLQDNVSSSSFLVKITELEEDDAGMYWCGSDSKWSAGNYTKIELLVDASPLKMVAYIVPAVLLVLLVAMFIAYESKSNGAQARKDKRRRKLEAPEMNCVKPEDSVYKNTSHNDEAADVQEQLYENLVTTNDISSVYM